MKNILDIRITSFIRSRRLSSWVTIPQQAINLRSLLRGVQNKYHVFDYSYFFYSEISRRIDWLTAISGKAKCSSSNRNVTLMMSDWANVYNKIKASPNSIFVVVIDNAIQDARFTRMRYTLMKNLGQHEKYLSKKLKYLIVKRKQANERL
jgi:hypothetical protein